MAVAIAGCSAPMSERAQQEVPAALQEGHIVQDIKGSFSGRGYADDLVEALFAEALERDTALRTLIRDVDRQHRTHADSVEAHQRFEDNNRAYYEAALAHADRLSDSLERDEQRGRLRQSEARYAAAVADARESGRHYDAIRARTTELVELIKLQRTLEIMERYQRTERPDDRVLEAELNRIKALEQRLRAAAQE